MKPCRDGLLVCPQPPPSSATRAGAADGALPLRRRPRKPARAARAPADGLPAPALAPCERRGNPSLGRPSAMGGPLAATWSAISGSAATARAAAALAVACAAGAEALGLVAGSAPGRPLELEQVGAAPRELEAGAPIALCWPAGGVAAARRARSAALPARAGTKSPECMEKSTVHTLLPAQAGSPPLMLRPTLPEPTSMTFQESNVPLCYCFTQHCSWAHQVLDSQASN